MSSKNPEKCSGWGWKWINEKIGSNYSSYFGLNNQIVKANDWVVVCLRSDGSEVDRSPYFMSYADAFIDKLAIIDKDPTLGLFIAHRTELAYKGFHPCLLTD